MKMLMRPQTSKTTCGFSKLKSGRRRTFLINYVKSIRTLVNIRHSNTRTAFESNNKKIQFHGPPLKKIDIVELAEFERELEGGL